MGIISMSRTMVPDPDDPVPPHARDEPAGDTDTVEERYDLDDEAAAPKETPHADEGPDAHVGGGQDLTPDDRDGPFQEQRERMKELLEFGEATGELPDDVEPINATGFNSTDRDVSTLGGSDESTSTDPDDDADDSPTPD
jgi:hypothetical protein